MCDQFYTQLENFWSKFLKGLEKAMLLTIEVLKELASELEVFRASLPLHQLSRLLGITLCVPECLRSLQEEVDEEMAR